jgi:hypothetical protein
MQAKEARFQVTAAKTSDHGTNVLPKALPAAETVEEGLANIAEYGVTRHKSFLPAELVGRLRERLIEQAEMEQRLGLAMLGGARGTFDQLQSVPGDDRTHIYQLVDFLPNKGRVFIDLMMSALPRAYATGVLRGYPYQIWSYGGLISRRGLAQQAAHIDQSNLPAEMCTMPAMLNIFICLSEFEPEMGSTRVALGSHKRPRPRYGDAADEAVPFVAAVAQPGDAIIWEGRTWHGNGAHNSPKTRYAIALDYGLASATPQDVYTSLLQDDVYETLNEDELNMLGFKTQSAGYSGRIAPRNAFDRRVNTNRAMPFVPELRRP